MKTLFSAAVAMLLIGCTETAPTQSQTQSRQAAHSRESRAPSATETNYVWGSKPPGQIDPPHNRD